MTVKTNYDAYMESMTALNKLALPRPAKVFAFLVMFFITSTLLMMIFVPWVQTAKGIGVVSTLMPEHRMQAISALVDGQIKHWHVQEGQKVKAGEPIVTLRDIDVQLVERLNMELEATKGQHRANQKALKTAEQDLIRRKALLKQGLVSQRDLEQAQIRLEDMKVNVAKSQAAVNRTEVKLARQSTQTKHAPMDGTIIRLFSAGTATFVKAGDILATFIPDNVQRAVVLEVNGIDATLIKPGRKVRLQFDGWPVLQFSGWPSVAIGTFGGVVSFVEPMASAAGKFRVWITEDPQDEGIHMVTNNNLHFDYDGWPDDNYVRLGSRAKGWVLLDEVPLGYEVWRQLNNFPPEYPEESKTNTSAGDEAKK